MSEKKQPEWLNDEGRNEVDLLREAHAGHPHIEKMVNTVFALAGARMLGESESSVFKRREVCSKKTYHESWKDDPHFGRCLEELTKIAKGWKDDSSIRSLRRSREIIVEASDKAAGNIFRKMGSYNEYVSLRASEKILAMAHRLEDQIVIEKIMGKLDLQKFSSEQMARIRKGEHPLLVITSDYLLDD